MQYFNMKLKVVPSHSVSGSARENIQRQQRPGGWKRLRLAPFASTEAPLTFEYAGPEGGTFVSSEREN
jgi:hypothetical protein